jgi:hypothetical protein
VRAGHLPIIVDVKNNDARKFYEDHDFVHLPFQPMRLYYLMQTIAGLFPVDALEK